MQHKILMENVLYCQVCSKGTAEEAQTWLNEENPPGTSYGQWVLSDVASVKCAEDKNKTHYLFAC